MNTTLPLSYVSQLPENTSRARELRWAMELYQAKRTEAECDRERAWQIYYQAVDDKAPREEINELYLMCEMFDAIADEAWHDLDNAKADYLRLFS